MKTREREKNYSFFQVRHFNTEVSGWASSSPAELTAAFSTAASPRFCNWPESRQRGRGGWGQAPAVLFHQAVHGHSCASREETARSWSPASGGGRCLEKHPYSTKGLMRPQLHSVYDPPPPLFDCKIVKKPWPVKTVSLLTKTWLMSSLIDVPDTGWCRSFIGVWWKHVCLLCYALYEKMGGILATWSCVLPAHDEKQYAQEEVEWYCGKREDRGHKIFLPGYKDIVPIFIHDLLLKSCYTECLTTVTLSHNIRLTCKRVNYVKCVRKCLG